jgi:hypothetical protein
LPHLASGAPSALSNVNLLFQIRATATSCTKQNDHFLPKSLPAAAVTERPSGDPTEKLHFKQGWVTNALSPKLQTTLAEGLRDLQFPEDTITDAVGPGTSSIGSCSTTHGSRTRRSRTISEGKWVSSSSWQGEVSSPSELLNPVPVHKLACGWLLLVSLDGTV